MADRKERLDDLPKGGLPPLDARGRAWIVSLTHPSAGGSHANRKVFRARKCPLGRPRVDGAPPRGCSSDTPAPAFKDKGEAPPDTTTPAQAEYPEGPYGFGVKSTISPYVFYGWHNPQISSGDLEEVSLAEFYNPTGDGVFPDDSIYRPGEPKPTVLLLDVSAQWCPPCQSESKTELPALYTQYHDRGFEIILELNQQNNGDAALPKHLGQWTHTYKTAWPAVVDPTSELGALYDQEAFPTNLLIDTTTMTVVARIAGAPPMSDPFWTTMKKYLKP